MGNIGIGVHQDRTESGEVFASLVEEEKSGDRRHGHFHLLGHLESTTADELLLGQEYENMPL
jgi:hypothetical protein